VSASVSRSLFNALVARGGGVDAAAAVLSAYHGSEFNKSSVSRMCSGSINVTPEALIAMEDHCGEFPFSEYMAARLAQHDDDKPVLLAALSAAIKETGEGLSAAAEAADGGDFGRAIAETQEAVSALSRLLRGLEAAA